MTDTSLPKDDVILVADDNEPARKLMAAILEKEGYEVMQAIHGAAAVKVAHEYNVICAVVDQYMEPKGGFDFARHVETFRLPIPMLLVTGHITSDLLEQARRAGFFQVLQKPITPERLVKTVDMAMKKYRPPEIE